MDIVVLPLIFKTRLHAHSGSCLGRTWRGLRECHIGKLVACSGSRLSSTFCALVGRFLQTSERALRRHAQPHKPMCAGDHMRLDDPLGSGNSTGFVDPMGSGGSGGLWTHGPPAAPWASAVPSALGTPCASAARCAPAAHGLWRIHERDPAAPAV